MGMRRLGREPTRKQVREMIEDVDDNGNGQIEFDEFVLLMRKLFPERDDKPKWRGVLGGLGRVFSKVDTFDKTKYKENAAERAKQRRALEYHHISDRTKMRVAHKSMEETAHDK